MDTDLFSHYYRLFKFCTFLKKSLFKKIQNNSLTLFIIYIDLLINR